MEKMEFKMSIQNKIRVFISSAQKEEEGFDWESLRYSIKEHLNKCDRIEAFTIEDYASTFPSNQFMLGNVDDSDVVVLLVKGTVRSGTQQEFERVYSNKKPLLLYFIESDNVDDSVLNLRKRIQEIDFSNYKDIHNDEIDYLEEKVLDDLLNDVIFGFKRSSHWKSNDNNTITDYDYSFSSNVLEPRKEYVNYFQSSYNILFKWLGITNDEEDNDSELHCLGVALIDWLIKGDVFEYGKPIKDLIDVAAQYKLDESWLKLRWDAIIESFNGNYNSALNKEEEALEKAKEKNVPEWIIHNILIDCRNMQLKVSPFENKYQDEIDSFNSPVYFPVLDRYLEQIYGNLLKEEFRFSTAGPNTQIIGSSFQSQITSFINYYFTSAIYGSYTHMFCAREYLFKIIYKISDITNSSLLLYKALQLLVLHGESKRFSSLITSKWDSLYSSISAEPDLLWQLANKSTANRDSMCLTVIKHIGLYFSNRTFKEVEVYLSNKCSSVNANLYESFNEALLNVFNRLDSEELALMIITILQDDAYITGYKLSRLIMRLNIDEIKEDTLIKLRDVLELNIDKIVERNGSPQFVASLMNSNSEVFHTIYEKALSYIKDEEKAIYDLNTGVGDWTKVLREEIQIARDQYSMNSSSGVHHEFATNPYAMIHECIRSAENNNKEVIEILSDSLLPFIIEVLSSDCDIGEKGRIFSCLIDVIGYLNINGITINPKLLPSLQEAQHTLTYSYGFGLSFNAFQWLSKFAILALNNKHYNSIVEVLPKYSDMEDRDRIAIAKGIEQLLYYLDIQKQDVDAIYFISLLLFEDSLPEIREFAVDCIARFIDSTHRVEAEAKLISATNDPSHMVRYRDLWIAKTFLKNTSISNSIIEILSNDAHYGIRKYAST